MQTSLKTLLGAVFEVLKELCSGFLENVYENALFIAMKQKRLNVSVEQSFEVVFRNHKIGKYIADLIVENLIVSIIKWNVSKPSILTILISCSFSRAYTKIEQ